jgi:hypothetical protein
LANGLRKAFRDAARQFFKVAMQKLREKKPLLVEQAYSCMDRFVLYSVSVEEVAEEVREGLADKNPTMKL